MPFEEKSWKFPAKEGLYDPSLEKDACGVGFIVNIDGKCSNKIVREAKTLSQRMEHRGATSADNDTGDGAGAMVAIPHQFYQKEATRNGITLPDNGSYATGIFFVGEDFIDECMSVFEAMAEDHNLKVIWWRNVPRDNSCLGQVAAAAEPVMIQPFVVSKDPNLVGPNFEKVIFILRKMATHGVANGENERFYICSLSSRTIVYKGQFNPCQIWKYFAHDLLDEDFLTYLCIVHTRFSTNTFPSWERAHPNRMLAHNGEINTLRGNINLMKAREGVMANEDFGDELASLYPVVEHDMSDSGCVDNVLEFLVMAGNRTLPEAVMTMVPEAWQNDTLMPDYKKSFYRFAASLFEPWDGPALLTFSDGRYVGAILDRNGLRPSRFYVTADNTMIMASEVGVFNVEPENIIQKGRLKPGRMLLVDTKKKCIIRDEELKREIASSRPHDQWWKEHVTLEDLRKANTAPIKVERQPIFHKNFAGGNNLDCSVIGKVWSGDRRMPLFGYTIETLQMLLVPMFHTKKEALGSMGNDAPLACLSRMAPMVYDYFKQLFAQVTNPPIDPFREKIVMSLACPIGPEGNALQPNLKTCQRLWIDNPILSLSDMEVIKYTSVKGWKTKVLDITVSVANALDLELSIKKVCEEAELAAKQYQFLVLSDKKVNDNRCPISAILVAGAVHHHLINKRLRSKCAIILETGEIREVHQICVSIGYGVDAICPYMVFELAQMLQEQNIVSNELTDQEVYQNYADAVDRGISKVMAKMGISTMQSYKGAQIFEAVGIADEVVDLCFKGTASRIGGVGFEVLAIEAMQRHCLAFGKQECDSKILRDPGFLHFRSGGEKHMNEPNSVALLQDAARRNNKSAYQKFVDNAMQSVRDCTIRGQLQLVYTDKEKRVDISEVEPASEIVKRFATGAMSFGSISYEAHSTLAVAMNRLGGKSNTGEGGENPERYLNQDPDMNHRSAIKQVASGRFGVTIAYLSNADELQIKMAQGAKPGEGGELPGFKVTEDIAKTRHSVPGVGLISPPPHHDIYSIEDLAQLIYDLKCANPSARVSVKLVSEVGVGIVASGVAKGKSEHILISGHDGGTGASSWTGIKGAGLPWELGIAETHQILTMNNLRSRVVLQADGQMRTAFDVAVAAILGADEFGFSTAPLIVMGCTMMRKCHLNTCPVGIATQDPVLRKKFEGKPEHVVNFFFMVAEEIREILAKLGCRKLQDIIGHTEFLSHSNTGNYKGRNLDLSEILINANTLRSDVNIVGGSVKQDFELESRLDTKIIPLCMDVIDGKAQEITLEYEITNFQRTFGATLSHEIGKKFVDSGLPEPRRINLNLKGSAGQSFCAFLAKGVYVTLEGDSNDYVCKGLSGGEVVIKPSPNRREDFKTEENVIAGNVCLYGATSGKVLIRGMVAERFCVRNSGATAIVEGVGDHGCEYMTGGRVVILGLTGRNFAAGMSGGIAYVLDIDGSFRSKCNLEMVELLELNLEQDVTFVKELISEFVEKTGSVVGQNVLDNWETSRQQFIKVFPYEYQRALKELEMKKVMEENPEPKKAVGNGAATPAEIEDIESMVKDNEMIQKKTEIVLDKTRGFVKYKRETKMYRDAEERQKDWDEIYDFKNVRKNLRTQTARCMDCGVPFCHSTSVGCPLGNIIPKFNDLVFHENWKEALHQLLQTNNFPEFTGRVCPAPCEGACVLGINEPPVTIKNIECAIIDNAFDKGWIKPEPPARRSGKKVAIVGSGPSGLAAADQLNKAGHFVTIYERNNRLGGLLQYGIPTMKLSRAVVQRRLDLLQEEGIIFKPSVSVGKDISAKELMVGNDALLLCMGATWPRDLPIPGRDAGGIHFAMEFLQTWQQAQYGDKVNEQRISAKDLDVVVIGGGDTGCDCIGTSLRQGAKSITAFEILPEPPTQRAEDNPWPQYPKLFKLDYGHEEVATKWGKGDPRKYNTMSKEFLKDSKGQLSGIKTVLVEWVKDANGRWNMSEVPNSEKVYPCQMALLAMGFLGPEKEVISELQLDQDPRSNIKTSEGKFSTVVDGVFAAGDCRRGQSLVVWAITEGRQAAKEVDEYLMTHTLLPGLGGVIHPTAELSVAHVKQAKKKAKQREEFFGAQLRKSEPKIRVTKNVAH